MDETKYVDCCAEFGKLMEELPSDQLADPGYRHIRILIISPEGASNRSVRARFCPWCGAEFKIDAATTRVAQLEQKLAHSASLNCSLVTQNNKLAARNLELGDTPAPIDWSKGFVDATSKKVED